MKKILIFISILLGLSSVPLLAQGLNMNKYVTLTVLDGKAIKLNFKAAQLGTPVRIVSGSSITDITVGTDWYNAGNVSTYTVQSSGTEMKIYGDIVGFRCNGNTTNLTAIDPSHNNDLRELNCADNAITQLNVSTNTQLKRLWVYGNSFTTLEYDKLFCSLPSAFTSSHGIIYPLNRTNDVNRTKVLAANAGNTLVKSWEVRYWNENNVQQDRITTTGAYVCGSPEANLDKHVTINALHQRAIALKFKAKLPNTTIRIETGNNIQEYTVGTDWNTQPLNVSALGPTIKISGNIYAIDCSRNGNNVTGVTAADNTELEELFCSGNNISTLDVTANTNLKTLVCFNNKLKALNLAPLNNLEYLDCNSNQIDAINLSNKPQLKFVNVGINKLTELAFNESPLLRSLDCSGNSITALDFTNQSKLEEVFCSNNKITSLDLSGNTLLTTLHCNDNELTTLNINNTPKLTTLSFFANRLTTYEIDKVFCALPQVEGNPGRVYPINYQQAVNDPNIRVDLYVVYTNGDNAKAKNWEIKNWNNGRDFANNRPHDVITAGTYVCGSTPADLTNFVTLQVVKSDAQNNTISLLDFNFKAPRENTNVRIVNGANVQEFTVGTDFANAPFRMAALEEEVKIYGDFEVFNCSHNLEKIKALDASTHPQLKEIHCNNNEISAINVSNLVNLNTLQCENNQIAELNLNDNANLVKVDCSNNLIDKALNFDNNIKLAYLACNNNQIPALSLVNNIQLAHLECQNNLLPKLNLESNVKLRRLYCYNNLFNTEAVNKIYCDLPKVTGNPGLCYMLNTIADANHETTVAATTQNARYKNWEVKYFNNNQNQQNDIASSGNYDCGLNIPTPNPEGGYMTLTVKDGAEVNLKLRAFADNTPARLASGNIITDITVGTKWQNVQFTADGTTITIYGKIDGLNCSENGQNITKVDGGNNTFLKDLYCYTNYALTEINLSDNSQLRDLHCYEANLTSLDLTNNPELKTLLCNVNNIANIDLSQNTELVTLWCNNNGLKKLNLSKNKKLKDIRCNVNQIAVLDLTNNPALTYVNCSENIIDSLYLFKNELLEELYCNNNNLTVIDLSDAVKLAKLNCSFNKLEALSLGANIELTQVICNSNNIPELNFSSNTKLAEVVCYNNALNTDAVNEVYCSLPERVTGTLGKCYPLHNEADDNHALIVAATSKNARDKKWDVKYKSNGADVPNNGIYDCNAVLDSTKLITLVVSKDTNITLNFRSELANTRVSVVNGNKVLNTMVSQEWKPSNYIIRTNHDTVKIYGNISGLNCENNTTELRAIDLSNNSEIRYLHIANNSLEALDLSNQSNLTELDCQKNYIKTLDISNKTLLKSALCNENMLVVLKANNNQSLTSLHCENNMLPYLDIKQSINISNLHCYNNLFSTEAMNQIYCSLPTRSVNENGVCYPLNDKSDANHANVLAATSSNARNKNWSVNYFDSENVIEAEEDEVIPNNGNYDCNALLPDLSKHITVNVKKGEKITVDFLANKKNAIVHIVSGNTVQNVTAVTDWNIASYTVSGDADTIGFYGDIIGFSCSNNKDKVTGINVSNNTQLRELNCFNNKISNIDLTKNTELEVLAIGNNHLNTLDLTKNTELVKLHIDGNTINNIDLTKNVKLITLTANANNLTEINLSENIKLEQLELNSNKLTALDLSKNTNLKSLICYNNPFTTRAVNELYCSLPTVEGQAGLCFTLNTKNDANHVIVAEATSQNAVDKNWEVKYYNNGSLPYNDIQSNGNYECGSEIQEPNMNRYITLNVTAEQNIKLDFKANEPNTPVRIICGDETTNIEIGTNWYKSDYSLTAKGSVITVYGNIAGFNCANNEANLTAIDVKNNTLLSELICNNNKIDTLDLSLNAELKKLNCANNQLRYLDVRNNAKLELINCYNNPFTTFAVNVLYCSLQPANGKTAICYTLNSDQDANYSDVIAATSNNAREKNWKVLFVANEENVPSYGNFDCNSGVDASEFSGITVFPNPAYGKVQVKLDEAVNETLILVDLNGRALLTADVVAGRADLDLSNLTAGTYFIRVGNRVQKLTVK